MAAMTKDAHDITLLFACTRAAWHQPESWHEAQSQEVCTNSNQSIGNVMGALMAAGWGKALNAPSGVGIESVVNSFVWAYINIDLNSTFYMTFMCRKSMHWHSTGACHPWLQRQIVLSIADLNLLCWRGGAIISCSAEHARATHWFPD